MRICPLCKRNYQSAEIKFCADDGQPLVEQTNLLSQSEPQPAVAERAAAPFSASLMMAFFAHHFVEQSDIRITVGGAFGSSGSTDIPCQSNVKVNATILAYKLLAISFWNLRENNLIRFATGTEQGLISKYTTLLIEFNRANQTQIPGLEYDLMEIIKQSPPGATVVGVAQQILENDSYNPHEKVFQRLAQWMIHLGYGQPDVSKKPFFRRLTMNFEFIPDCQRIAEAQPTAQIVHRKWTQFQAEQPDVYNLLYKAMKTAFSNNLRTSDST